MKIIPIKDFPIAFFAMSLACSGLTLAWRHSGLSKVVDTILTAISIIVFLFISIRYFIKIIKHHDVFIAELHHPIMLSFFGAATASIMLVSNVIPESMSLLALSVWSVGSVLQVLLLFYVLTRWFFHHTLKIEDITPAYFMPIVGMLVMPLYGINHGFIELSWYFFSVGFFLGVILFLLAFYRLVLATPLPASMQPTLFILLAPPSLAFSNYVHLTGEHIDTFSKIIYSIPLLFLCLFLINIKKFKMPFSMSHWAFTFPVIAFTMATMLMGQITNNNMITIFSYILLFGITLVVTSIFILTLKNVLFIPTKKGDDTNLCINKVIPQ